MKQEIDTAFLEREIVIDLRFLRRYWLIFLVLLAALVLSLMVLRLGKASAQGALASAEQATTPTPTTAPAQYLAQVELPGEVSVPTATAAPQPPAPSPTPTSPVSPGFIGCVQCEPEGLPVPAGKGVAVTCRFRDPDAPGHKGLDIAVPVHTEVRATHDGVVTRAEYDPLYGNLVVVQNPHYTTWYAHNAYLLVRQGDLVHRDDLLALSGSTGRSTGPHLHYEVHDSQDTPLDPEDFLGLDTEGLKFRGCESAEGK